MTTTRMGKKPTNPNTRAAIYQNALAELRERHVEEFADIYERMMTDAGQVTLGMLNDQIKPQIIDFIAAFFGENNRGASAREIAEHFGMKQRTINAWLIELRDEERIIAPGSGNRNGYLPVVSLAMVDRKEA